MPDCFKEVDISYHNENSWRNGYFQSAAIGQEFVIKDNEDPGEWAKGLIERAQIDML